MTVKVEIKSDAVALITLNRPGSLNAFDGKMRADFLEAVCTVSNDKAVRAIVITGDGRGFCAGQDLSDRAVAPDGDNIDLGASLEERYNPLIRRLISLPIPVVCAVNGVAAGAGANIALAADIVIGTASPDGSRSARRTPTVGTPARSIASALWPGGTSISYQSTSEPISTRSARVNPVGKGVASSSVSPASGPVSTALDGDRTNHS